MSAILPVLPARPLNPSDPASIAAWNRQFFEPLRKAFGDKDGILWALVNKDDSSLSDVGGGSTVSAHVAITNGNPHGTDHSALDSIAQADDTSPSTDGGKHVTNALVKGYTDHLNDTGIHHSQMAAQANSTALLLSTLVSDFNTLLAALRSSGRMGT